jgi:hypothetical protein
MQRDSKCPLDIGVAVHRDSVSTPDAYGQSSAVTIIDGQAYRNTIDAAELCGLSIAEFHRKVAAYPDRFKPKRLGQKCTRFKVADLIAAMDSFSESNISAETAVSR